MATKSDIMRTKYIQGVFLVLLVQQVDFPLFHMIQPKVHKHENPSAVSIRKKIAHNLWIKYDGKVTNCFMT